VTTVTLDVETARLARAPAPAHTVLANGAGITEELNVSSMLA